MISTEEINIKKRIAPSSNLHRRQKQKILQNINNIQCSKINSTDKYQKSNNDKNLQNSPEIRNQAMFTPANDKKLDLQVLK